MIAPASPMVRRRRLAAELRGIREGKGKSGDAVASALRWSPSKISRYERARTGLRPQEVERLLDYYEITGARRAHLLRLAQDAAQKGWWEEYADSLSEGYQQFIGYEHEATSMAIWHIDVYRPAPDRGLCPAHHQQLQPGRADHPRHDPAAGRGPDAAPASAGS
jgi:transcriptional regulator with XRE-family HTH domain